MRKSALFFILALLVASPAVTQTDTLALPHLEKKKKGWSFNPLPVVSYDSDLGFQFGALCQVFDYGDGSIYPDYRHMFYGEVSWYTKGTALYQLVYDSRHLIPGQIRTTFLVEYMTERAVDFYGFNGYEANYLSSLEKEDSEDYISRMFYRFERSKLRIVADFQGPIAGQKFRWFAGINLFDIKTGTVNIDKLNKGKPDDKKLPDTSLLYDDYVKYSLIREEEKDGGTTVFAKVGLVVDTRNHEAAPSKGIWSEAIVLAAPTFLGNNPYAFVKLAVTHRQYFPIFGDKLVAAYRLSYQGTIGGTTPFYIVPYVYASFMNTDKNDGLGGAKTLRGILRARVTGDGVAFGNLELRWNFVSTNIFKQHFLIGVLGFLDAGMVVQDHPVYRNTIPEDQQSFYFDQASDNLHLSAGLGLRFTVNRNFIVAVDWGKAFDSRDGNSGLYLGIGHLF
jgi:hypothetical protein